MSKIKIVSLGVHTIPFGIKDDPERIKKMVGSFTHYLDSALDPDRFADKGEPVRKGRGIADWPVDEEGKVKQVELKAACFDKYLPDYEAILNESASLPENMKKASFPHLATQFKKVDSLWMKHDIPILATPDETALWRYGVGALSVPYANCYPYHPTLDAHRVEHAWHDAREFFLFFSE